MTASLADVRTEIATALNGIEGLRASPYLKDQTNPLEAMIDVEGPTQATFSTAGAQTYEFHIVLFAQRTDERAAQIHFDELRDPFHTRSVKRAIEDSTTLAALSGIDFGEVGPATRVEAVVVGDLSLLSIEFPLTVMIHQGA